MADALATYTFLPWVRNGLGTAVTGSTGSRATIPVTLTVRGDGLDGSPATRDVTRSVALLGPGDVTGLAADVVVRSGPRPWTTGVEPNYLAFVDFYDEDLPWRFTPAPADGDRLTPWLTLAVLTEDEFTDVRSGEPLPVVDIHTPGAVLPPPDRLWAWAHVHVNGSLAAPTVSNDGRAAAAALGSLLSGDRDLAYSRLLSPRRLLPDTGYHAFVIPTYESGRRAGLGAAPGNDAAAVAWAPGDTATLPMPVYHRWYFRTGAVGDFESLVRLLRPRTPDARVGRRPLDTRSPGSSLPPIDVPGLGGVLQLGGALRVPESALGPDALDAVAADEAWDGGAAGGHPFGSALADLVNLTDDYPRTGVPLVGGADLMIAPPLYGRWHTLATRLLLSPDGSALPRSGDWVHRLNLDPRFRVPAALGTAVIQDRQEEYMAAAWSQIGDVLEANRAIRLARLARDVSAAWYRRTVVPIAGRSPARAVTLTAAVHARVLSGGVTLRHRRLTSLLPDAAVSGALRRMLRPGGRVARRSAAGSVVPGAVAADVLDGLAGGSLTASPPGPPLGFTTTERMVEDLGVAVAEPWLAVLTAWYERLHPSQPVGDVDRSPVVDGLPKLPGFTVTPLEEDTAWPRGDEDSEILIRFKDAVRDVHQSQAAAADAFATPPADTLSIGQLAADVVTGIDPAVTIPRRLDQVVALPGRITDALVPSPDGMVDEVLAYPVIDTPMYEHLTARSDQWFLPNLNLVPDNSITLLETNRRFIEAYMAGLNHEFGRELLWREYPTDQRGSTFRQFWDVREQLAATDGGPVAREGLRDIAPLHTWGAGTELGTHDGRDAGSDDELVLVIRGELLKRYPTAVVYAHRAEWARTQGAIDRTLPRRLATLPDGEPSRADVRTPLYRASVEGVQFLGFDLTVETALGGTDDNPGWFFVIKERPGEPRFGLDVDSDLAPDELRLWSDLAWEHVLGEPAGVPQFLPVDVAIPPLRAPASPDAAPQHTEDVDVRWGPGTNAAEIAYVLFQLPVQVAVHTAEMLRARP